ncbi:RNA polymerase sigma-70 factor [Sphingobacterium deserti]|uniref:RNA polymerase sigma factor n=1 Tax=Sphingobacterium deserti TaxID=1229276 RepID=A0A0B8T2H7_9SPHI|nr:RNA polymerase sigma-70 factor [Sphingobacterium deserti]KGE15507.1 RNA polymerase ECF-type sigma factor [Sphingobacterium deserti]
MIDEKYLLSAIAKGDTSAFKILYDHYYPIVHRFASQLVPSKSMAQDVVQDVMIVVWEKGRELHRVENIESYIKSIAKRKVIDLIRRDIRFKKYEQHRSCAEVELSEALIATIYLKETNEHLNNGIALLPKQQQLVYRMCHQQYLKYEEVAAKLGISKGTVHKHMKLALKFLRDYLRKYVILSMIMDVIWNL